MLVTPNVIRTPNFICTPNVISTPTFINITLLKNYLEKGMNEES